MECKTITVTECMECPFGRDPDPYPIYCAHPDGSDSYFGRDCPLEVKTLLIERAPFKRSEKWDGYNI